MQRARSSSVRELHESIRGLEKKATPYLLGVMNLLLHGVEQPRCVPGEITARRASARGAWRAMVPQAHLFPPQAPRADHPFVSGGVRPEGYDAPGDSAAHGATPAAGYGS